MDNLIRGSMWWAAIPHDSCNPHSQSGMRPVVVVSNDMCNEHSPSLLVCPITTRKDKYYFIHPHIKCASSSESYVLCEQVKVLDKSLLGTYIGQVRNVEQDFIDRALMVSLGLSPYLEKIDHLRKELAELTTKFETLQSSTGEHSCTCDKDALEIGMHIKGIFDLLSKCTNEPESQPAVESIVQSIASNENITSQPNERLASPSKSLTAVEKFNARLEKTEKMKKEGSAGLRKQVTEIEITENLSRPNARKWDNDTIKTFVKDYVHVPEEELLKKYNLNSFTTATKYYLRFKKNESL